MASSAGANPETLITLKVSCDGVTRRFKLPLRDLVPESLDQKLRSSLHISSGTKTVIERFSDSAASYVLLDSDNISVYKQLYRAAKAKQKLKLKVTTTEPEVKEEKDANIPKPVSIEDEPEVEASASVSETRPASSVSTVTSPPEQSPATAAEPKDTTVASQVPTNAPESNSVPWFARLPEMHRGSRTTADASQADPVATFAPLPETSSSLDNTLPTDRSWFSSGMPRLQGVLELEKMSEQLKRDVAEIKRQNDLTFAESMRQTQLTFAESMRKTQDSLAGMSLAGLMRQPPTGEVGKKDKPVANAEPAPALASKQGQETTPSAYKATTTTRAGCPFTVCCNSCDRPVPDAHFHCSTCDDGDFDLCQNCVDQGITCYDANHWMIKRTVKDGKLGYSTTHVAPKSSRSSLSKPIEKIPAPVVPSHRALPIRPARVEPAWAAAYNTRTCNCCVQEFPEREFLNCTTCEDYDLCRSCFTKDQHGHHPKHGFVPAVKGTAFDVSIKARMKPGRNFAHRAICDGCDKNIKGIRHKCLDCPDWDYCSECATIAHVIHPNHRFLAAAESIPEQQPQMINKSLHSGICCDGPLCTTRGESAYIRGDRYKCAVCNDTDFCENCEASPANTHNKTHPLIKFKTPVRHVSVTTTGEHKDGQPLPAMGDRVSKTSSRATETDIASSPRESITVNPVQTVVDMKPTEPLVDVQAEIEPEVEPKVETKVETKASSAKATPKLPTSDLVAAFKYDTVEDGTVMPANHTFEQTWVLKNEGQVAWPAGCKVKFTGGDWMGAVDPTHPAGIHELVSASESTVCYDKLSPGKEFPFTVLLRTPDSAGTFVSHWRLTAPDDVKFGHKLWCEIQVEAPALRAVKQEEEAILDSKVPDMAQSQMIIPKLDHESPASSMHVPKAESECEATTETDTLAASVQDNEDDFEDCAANDDWAEESDDGFMTDEEYDILDASDEEYLDEQQKPVARK